MQRKAAKTATAAAAAAASTASSSSKPLTLTDKFKKAKKVGSDLGVFSARLVRMIACCGYRGFVIGGKLAKKFAKKEKKDKKGKKDKKPRC